MFTELLTGVGAALAVVAGVAAALWRAKRKGRSEGRAEAETEAMRDAQERTERGRDAVSRGRASGASADERLRRNDDSW